MRVHVLIVFVAAALGSIVVRAADSVPDHDVKQFSYVCLEANQEVCLGISPGNSEPSWKPNDIFDVQVKSRRNNEFKGDDYKKTRWDVDFVSQQISLSRFGDLCVTKHPYNNQMELRPCDGSYGSENLFDLSFNTNINQAGYLRLKGTTLCGTVMRCQSGGNSYCSSSSTQVATGVFEQGSYVKFRTCWDAENGDPAHKSAQVFRQALDCAVGCTPFLLYGNDVCDPECQNDACDFDNRQCATPSPTPPTMSPTQNPTTSPTLYPTLSPTLSPTGSPTTATPSTSPTYAPSLRPSTSPTQYPTANPTTRGPTTSPTLSPSASPTISPTPSPSEAPSAAPTALPRLSASPPGTDLTTTSIVLLSVFLPILLIILAMCCFAVVLRRREKEAKKDPKRWKSPIDMNQALHAEFHRQKEPTYCGCFARSSSRGAANGPSSPSGWRNTKQPDFEP